MTEVTEHFLKNLEDKRGIHLPICIFKDEQLKRIDVLIKNGSPFSLSVFFDNYLIDKVNNVSFDFLSKELKHKRAISDTDSNLITDLCKINLKDSFFVFDFVSNFYYIGDTLTDANNQKELSKSLRYTISLWCYLNLIELLTKYISAHVKIAVEEHIKTNKEEKKIKIYSEFLDSFKDNRHPEMGKLIFMLEKLKLLTNKKDSIFSKGKLIRNAISHANIYYDKDDDSFWLSTGDKLTVKEFNEYLNKVYDFLLEFIYQYNKKSTDLTATMNSWLYNVARELKRIERNGNAKRRYREIYININKN